MEKPIKRLVVVGGGSAGFLAALSFRIFLPGIKRVVVHSADIPVIGVGESTTQGFVDYLHKILRLNEDESRHWQANCQRIREEVQPALPVKDALLRMYEECRSWPKEGI